MESLAELARRAYAIGWARSGGPMTDRVRAGSVAAVTLALEAAARPGVLEVTLDLGHLEGVWADLYRRRDEVEARNLTAIRKVWAAYVARLDMDRLVRGLARRLGITEADDDLSHGGSADELATIIRATLQDLDVHGAEWTAMREAFRDALAAARAEGATGAVALAVREHTLTGTVRTDFELAFEDAYRNLEHVTSLWGEGTMWIETMFGYAAGDIGRALGGLTRAGASYDDIRDTVAGYLNDPDMRAVDTAVNQLTGKALSQGALDLYGQAGVREVDFLTGGDGRVCKLCEDAESEGPYRLGVAPTPPLHPFCRCSLAARDVLPANLFARYLTPTEGQ